MEQNEVLQQIDYDGLIPNNVNLAGDRRLQRALEKWHPGYLNWWTDMGPQCFQEKEVYLRTAIGVDPGGWAVFDFVKMPEYRWGILLTPAEENRTIPFGRHKGEPAWQEVPGEYRSLLRRLIVIQGDTEPASIEQQRFLGMTAPSLYDLRNLFQVNVEEGRHLWAMVYLLQRYFGKDGREEAEMLLQRQSGNEDKPRLLGAFNEETSDWLSFFMFTFFTDRDGKMQLHSLSQSGFDPLSRTCRFMLTEEAHHMFVGESGIARVIERTCDAMRDAGIDDPTDIEAVRALGVVDLPTLQKKINFHYSVTLDLFGSEVSTNAAAAFEAGIKGRYKETRIDDDHQLHSDTYPVTRFADGAFNTVEEPAINAINARLQDDYINEASGGVARWNKLIDKHGFDFDLQLPHRGFHRKVGLLADLHTNPQGGVVDAQTWRDGLEQWLPSSEDMHYISTLMVPVSEPGKYAGWIAPPKVGINQQPGDFEYVRLEI